MYDEELMAALNKLIGEEIGGKKLIRVAYIMDRVRVWYTDGHKNKNGKDTIFAMSGISFLREINARV